MSELKRRRKRTLPVRPCLRKALRFPIQQRADSIALAKRRRNRQIELRSTRNQQPRHPEVAFRGSVTIRSPDRQIDRLQIYRPPALYTPNGMNVCAAIQQQRYRARRRSEDCPMQRGVPDPVSEFQKRRIGIEQLAHKCDIVRRRGRMNWLIRARRNPSPPPAL